jgi:hypothetical protein
MPVEPGVVLAVDYCARVSVCERGQVEGAWTEPAGTWAG